MTRDEEQSEFRLPPSVVPRRYDLRLAPDLDEARFDGEELIEIEILDRVEAIYMNSAELEIPQASVRAGWDQTGEWIELAVEFEEATERVRLGAPSSLEPGRHTLRVQFSGILNDKLHGFYRSTFVDDLGVERVVATTQFEQTDARRAFPCFDEPAMKAAFTVALDVDEELLAVSNAREVSSTPLGDGKRRVQFAETMVMSTYLVAFVVGPLEATEPVEVHGVALRVIHAPGKGNLCSPALECAAHALAFYPNYFGIPYPADKLDLVAIPDFAAGAMENLGCVTFREAILLADPNATSRAELQRLAEVVEHEIAHMWFGDLVTMRWWNGIWLNEAFATFMALRCQDDYKPEWNCFVGFARDKAAALTIDGLHTTRPIEFPVNHPDEAGAMFDVLTYEKGASVLWMLERYVGEGTFRSGVRRYLSAHLYSNTETTDLWDAIEQEAGDAAIRAVMDSWIFQGGYPLVEVAPSDSGSAVELSQRPFAYLSTGVGSPGSAIGSDWLVPIVYRSATGEGRLVLSESPTTVATEGRLTVLNSGGAGFYRLKYEADALKPITDGLSSLEPGERFNVVSDTWAVALAGLGELSQFFELLDRLGEESNPDVWSVVIGAFAVLDRLCAKTDRALVADYARSTLRPVLDRVGWSTANDEDEQIPLLRSSLISALGTYGRDQDVVARARELFVADHDRREAFDPDLINAVLSVIAANATPHEFDQILARYRDPETPMDQVRHLNCLVALTDDTLAAQVREMCRGEVRSQNAPYLLGGMLRGREIGMPTWRFLVERFDELQERFPANSIHRMLDGLALLVEFDASGNAPIVEEVKVFCDERIEPARRRLVDQSVERLSVNVAFAQREGQRLAGLLSDSR